MAILKSFILILLVSIAAATAAAEGPLRLAQAAVSPDEAAAVARSQTGGRVLGVDWSEGGGGPVYLVKVLMPDGSIRIVPVAARSSR